MQSLLSHRIKTLPPAVTIAISQNITTLKEQGHEIINLSIGEPDFKTPLPIQQATKQAIDAGSYFSYPPVAGYTDLQAAIVDKVHKENGIACTPEQVVISNGSRQSLFNVFFCLLDPGDEVIVYTPHWFDYVPMIQLAGGTPILVSSELSSNFEITPEQLHQALTPKTKAIVFSNPCNPTGHVFSRQELEAMAAVLVNHPHVLVIADEVDEYINFTGTHHSIGSLPNMQDRVVTINGFSKSFSMAGWRIGYMVAPIWLAKACEKAQGQITSASSSIAQRAALAALRAGREVIQPMIDTYLKRRDCCLELLADIPRLRCSKPLGTFYVFPDVSAYWGCTDGQWVIQHTEDLCKYLLQKAQIAVIPGSAFGAPKHVRITCALDEKQLLTAFKQLKAALANLKSPE